MLFPWHDWQFWLVTATAAWCAWVVVKQFRPRRGKPPVCGSCATGAAACAKKPPAEAGRKPSLVVLESRRRY